MQNNFNSFTDERRTLLYRTLYLLSITLLLIVIIISGINAIIYFNQKLYIVNGFNKEAIIQLKTGKIITIKPNNKEVAILKEGKIELKIRLGNDEEYIDKFVISNKFWERFNYKKVLIYNIKGGAFILYEETEYSNKISIKNNNDYIPTIRIYAGETFFKLKNIDYIFEEFPETLSIQYGSTKIVSRIGVLNLPFEDQFYLFYYYPVNDVNSANNYFNVHLKDNINNESFLNVYYNFCLQYNYFEEPIKKLESFLLSKPINIPIHRLYQNLYQEISEIKYNELLVKYKDFLKDQPNNSNLLYLYGRLLKNSKLAKNYYEASISNNEDNPYPWHALSYLYFSTGDFLSAKKCSFKAINIDNNSQLFKSHYNEILYANREYDQLINEKRSLLKNDPTGYGNLISLIELYLLKNDNSSIKELIEEYIKNYKEAYDNSDTTQVELLIILNQNCFEGKFDKMLNMIEKLTNKHDVNYWQFILNIENENMLDAEKNVEYNKENFSGYDFLLLYLGWIIQGNNNKANIWLKEAITYFKSGGKDEQQIAKLIESKNENYEEVLEELYDITLYPNYKRIIYLVMAKLYPYKKKDLINFARKFNYSISFPHYFINKTLSKL